MHPLTVITLMGLIHAGRTSEGLKCHHCNEDNKDDCDKKMKDTSYQLHPCTVANPVCMIIRGPKYDKNAKVKTSTINPSGRKFERGCEDYAALQKEFTNLKIGSCVDICKTAEEAAPLTNSYGTGSVICLCNTNNCTVDIVEGNSCTPPPVKEPDKLPTSPVVDDNRLPDDQIILETTTKKATKLPHDHSTDGLSTVDIVGIVLGTIGGLCFLVCCGLAYNMVKKRKAEKAGRESNASALSTQTNKSKTPAKPAKGGKASTVSKASKISKA